MIDDAGGRVDLNMRRGNDISEGHHEFQVQQAQEALVAEEFQRDCSRISES